MCGLRRVTAFVPLIILCLTGATCRKRATAPAALPVEQAGLPPLEVDKERHWLFTHVQPDGSFATVDDPVAVPEAARGLVRVIDPTKGVAERQDTSLVYVVDLNQLLKSGRVVARVLSRQAFETGALAQLPPGESSLLTERQPPPEPSPDEPSAAPGASPGGSAPLVTLYGTSWCGACRSAKQYLASKKIPFKEKDVERDPAAARELAQKAATLGIAADRVPVLEVRGRLLIGFDRARLDALLVGDPI